MSRISITVGEETTINRTVESDFTVGIVLETPRGQVNTPVEILSETDLTLKFGESTVEYPVLSFVRQYLRNYSGVYISRIKYKDAVPATVDLTNTEGTPVIRLSGNSYSDYENNQKVTVTQDDSTKLFTVTIVDSDGITQSTINEIPATNMNEFVLEYNSRSQYYTMELLAANEGYPTLDTEFVLTGGVKGSLFDKDDVIAAIKSFNTVNIVRLDSICAPGLNTETEVTNEGVKVAQSRKETIYLTDFPNNTDLDTAKTEASKFPRTDFCAIYYPSVLMQVPTGSSNFSKLDIPASAVSLYAYAVSAQTSRWTAPAGYNSSYKLPGVIRLTNDISSEEADEIYEATTERPAINPIIYDNTIGYLVDGQRTTALDTSLTYPINVSKLVKYVYTLTYQNSKGFRYKPNIQFTWDEWLLKMTTDLDNIKNSGGIDQYEVRMGTNTMTDDEIARGLMRGQVRIKPTFVAEYITVNIGITTDDIIVEGSTNIGSNPFEMPSY